MILKAIALKTFIDRGAKKLHSKMLCIKGYKGSSAYPSRDSTYGVVTLLPLTIVLIFLGQHTSIVHIIPYIMVSPNHSNGCITAVGAWLLAQQPCCWLDLPGTSRPLRQVGDKVFGGTIIDIAIQQGCRFHGWHRSRRILSPPKLW